MEAQDFYCTSLESWLESNQGKFHSFQEGCSFISENVYLPHECANDRARMKSLNSPASADFKDCEDRKSMDALRVH